MRKLYWGKVFAETDFAGCWCWAQVRPRWFWLIRRVRLFFRIVWRKYDDQGETRIDWRTAWDAGEAAVGFVGPVTVHKFPVKEKP